MKIPDYVKESWAKFSPDKKFRYILFRKFKNCVTHKNLIFVMLNPSTATKDEDDNSVRKCSEIAKNHGYDGVVIMNLFAIRSTDPKMLYEDKEPIGEENLAIIHSQTRLHIFEGKQLSPNFNVVVAWGNHGVFQDQNNKVLDKQKV